MAMDLPPIPFDVPASNSFEGLPGLDMAGAMPSPPPAAQGGQAPAQGGKGDRRAWLKLAAIIPAALKGGPGAMEGLLAGFQQAEAQRQQQAQVASADQRAQSQEQRLNQQASWQQQYQQAQLDAQAEQRRSELVKEFTTALTTDTVTDDEGVRALTQLYEARGRALWMRPGTFETTAMQVVKPSRLQRQAAQRKLNELQQRWGTANWEQEAGKFLHELPGGRLVTLPQLLEAAGMPANPQAPATSAAPQAQDWVIRNGVPTPIARGTAQPGDRPYDPVAARQQTGGGSAAAAGRGGAEVDTPNRALAEMAARSGQLPEGTPTQRGTVMQTMAGDPTLLAQYEDTRMEPIRAQARTMVSAIDDLLTKDDPNTPAVEGDLTPGARALFGSMTPVWSRDFGVRGGTVAANASLRQIVGQRVVDLIREMKGQSQTGATGFGQLNRAELDIILSAATRLTQRLPEAEARQELRTLREKFGKILQPSTVGPITVDGGDETDALLDELLGGGR